MREFVGEYGKGVRQENVRSKTKEFTGTLPHALSTRPSVITASSEDCQDLTTACQTEDANVVLQGRTVRVQTVYHNKDVVAVRHNPQKRDFAILAGFSLTRRSIRSRWRRFFTKE